MGKEGWGDELVSWKGSHIPSLGLCEISPYFGQISLTISYKEGMVSLVVGVSAPGPDMEGFSCVDGVQWLQVGFGCFRVSLRLHRTQGNLAVTVAPSAGVNGHQF